MTRQKTKLQHSLQRHYKSYCSMKENWFIIEIQREKKKIMVQFICIYNHNKLVITTVPKIGLKQSMVGHDFIITSVEFPWIYYDFYNTNKILQRGKNKGLVNKTCKCDHLFHCWISKCGCSYIQSLATEYEMLLKLFRIFYMQKYRTF